MSKPAFCLILLILSGCSDRSSESMLDNYTARLSNALDQPTAPLNRPLLPAFPPRRERILATQDIREGLLDVFQLGECGLLPLIAERNSSLGRVYTPASKLIYELRFLRAINRCHERLLQQRDSDPDLLAELATIRRTKQQNLPAELWNGIFTAPELEHHFARNTVAIATDDLNATSTISALETLLHLAAISLHDQLPDEDQLQQAEQAYAILHHSESGAQLLQGLNLLTAYLEQAADMIQHRLQRHPMCLQGRPTQQAKILRNVFQKFYAGDVQPYMALLQRQAGYWFRINRQLRDLFDQAGILPPAMRSYYETLLSEQNDSLWQRYLTARDAHTLAWQNILRQCGMMPSG